MEPQENINEEELLKDFIEYIDNKFSSIEHLCSDIPENVVVFKYTFPFGWDPQAITQVVYRSEVYLTNKLSKIVAIIPIMSNKEDMNIELIVPKSTKDEINELKEKVRKLSNQVSYLTSMVDCPDCQENTEEIEE